MEAEHAVAEHIMNYSKLSIENVKLERKGNLYITAMPFDMTNLQKFSKSEDLKKALEVLPSELLYRLESKDNKQVAAAFIKNIVLIIRHIEQSSLFHLWENNLKRCMLKFIPLQVAYLFLNDQLTDEIVRLLQFSKVVREDAGFHILIGLDPLPNDDVDDEKESEPNVLSPPQSPPLAQQQPMASTSKSPTIAAVPTPATASGPIAVSRPVLLPPPQLDRQSSDFKGLDHLFNRYYGYRNKVLTSAQKKLIKPRIK